MTEDPRDDELARALAAIPVPDYEPGFWERLDARLVGEPTLERTTVVPLARGRRRRRSLLVLAAAAAVVLAVVAVSVRDDGSDDVRTASEGTTPPSVASGSTTLRLRQPGTSSGAVEVGTSGATDTPQDAFATWADAIHVGNTDAAMAVTGPLTAAYGAALEVSPDVQVTGWGDVWGSWAEPADRRIDVVELGEIAGARVVAVVLQHPSVRADATRYDALPLVQHEDGWKVEPAAFPTSSDGRIEMVSPAPGEQGLEPLPEDEPIQIYSAHTGQYVLSLDLATGTRIDATDTEADNAVSWRPPASARVLGSHLLLVAHLAEDTISVQALPVTVRGADGAQP
jgi:hypothetical protein